MRLIAEQHIALSQALNNPSKDPCHVGVVNMQCSPKAMVNMCGSFVSELCEATLGVRPPIVIDGHVDATFAYVFYLLSCCSVPLISFVSQQLCASSSRVYNNGNPQKRLSGYCRTSPAASFTFLHIFTSPSNRNSVTPFEIARRGISINILLCTDTRSGGRRISCEYGPNILLRLHYCRKRRR